MNFLFSSILTTKLQSLQIRLLQYRLYDCVELFISCEAYRIGFKHFIKVFLSLFIYSFYLVIVYKNYVASFYSKLFSPSLEF